VREAVFSALDARDAVDGARVLDLFAGSGALGLEAASRGAVEVTLVDRAKTAADLCRRNAALVLGRAPKQARPRVTVHVQTAQAFLASAIGEWDLVFLDPPYDDAVDAVLAALPPHLSADAVVILERSARTPLPALPESLILDRTKTYGDTAVHTLIRG
jgi:16S rRNA (guanine966-N2)-methyltransferase